MAGFWDSLQSFIPETERTKMYKAENALRMRAMQREEDAAAREEENLLRQKQAMPALMNRLNTSGAMLPEGERTIENSIFSDMNTSTDELLGRVAPQAAMERGLAKAYPAAPEEYTLAPGAKRMRGQETVAENVQVDPKTEAAKLKQDLDNGLIDERTYNAQMFKMNSAGGADEETWSNPVAEVGPEGKPIQVRYGNKGGRKVVENATPSRQGNAFDRADYWRGQFKPYLDTAQNTVTQSRKIKSSLALGTGTGDIAAINAFQKQVDEGAVVRDQDVALIQSAQSLLGRFMAADGSIKKGTKLTPELRQELQAASDVLTAAIQDGVQSRIDPYTPTMKTEGVDLENIVPQDIQKFYGWKPPGAGWSIKKVN